MNPNGKDFCIKQREIEQSKDPNISSELIKIKNWRAFDNLAVRPYLPMQAWWTWCTWVRMPRRTRASSRLTSEHRRPRLTGGRRAQGPRTWTSGWRGEIWRELEIRPGEKNDLVFINGRLPASFAFSSSWAIPGLFQAWNKLMWKISIQSLVLWFEPTTYTSWVFSHHH